MAPFLTIYTPTYRRPRALARCVASVEGQARRNFEHIIYRDEVGEGIAGMFARLIENSVKFTGEYVYVLQDDDQLAGPDVTGQIEDFARANGNPPVIVARTHKGQLALPSQPGQRPSVGGIDLGNYIVRRDVFLEHMGGFATGRYVADCDFIQRVWDAGAAFTWCDCLLSTSHGWGHGRPEHA